MSDEQMTIGARKPLGALAVYLNLEEQSRSLPPVFPDPGRLELGPAPDPTGDPRLVGIVTTTPVLQHSSHPFYGPLLTTIRARLLESDCDVVSFARSPRSQPGRDAFGVDRWQRAEVAGLIMAAVGREERGLDLVLDSGIPVLFVDLDVLGKRAGHVMSNNLEGMAGVVEHLHALGHRRIATITGLLNAPPGADRVLGYRSGLARSGLATREDYIVAGDFFQRSGHEAARRLLGLPEPPDAIAAASDTMAVGAIAAIQQAGLRVPEDVAVTGFDDADFAARMQPALTTVRQDVTALGVAAAEALLRMLEHPDDPPPTLLLPTRLMIRESCGARLARVAG
ncbi:MAG: substrate-binding domain-containing protein [Gaiellaceae bacterium]